ncbi:junctional cadherin 5-associated protein [Equus przewalskii]|uniref:Junctional cadherin 5-associated protein n=1 Tax=Equus przewalskii TaxID=9798 RepID=A0ABM4MZ13_EQUPR
MYSVEDLLISHGYKLSRNLPAPHEDNYEGHQQARRGARAGHGLLNGCEDGPAAFPHSGKSLGKGHVSDSENSHRIPRGHGQTQSASASRTSEARFYHPPVPAWSSQPQTGHNRAYQGRQEVSGLLGPRDREDLEVRGMAQAHSLPIHVREGPWEVGRRTENVMKKAVWEELRMAGPAEWQNVSLESWNQPRKLGRQMSDGDGEKLFQDLYPFVQGEHVLNSQSKGKSQSLPRVLCPESLSCMEIPLPLNDRHLPSVPKMPSYPPNCAPHLEPTRNSEKGGSSVPLLRPKFGRPLKPPSYDSHQHSRGGVENSDYPDSQQTDLCVPHLTKTNDPRQELCAPDSGLEPPVYVPPPSYRSPPQHIANPYVEDAAPRPVCGGRRQQEHLTEKAGASCQLPSGSLGTGNEYGASPRSPRGLHPQPRPTAALDGSVLYIPFDDPRIRHIKLAQPQGFCEETKLDERLYSSRPVTPPEPARGNTRHGGANFNPQSLKPLPGGERGLHFADPSPRLLWGQLPRDGENGGFHDPRDHCTARGQRPDVQGDQHRYAEGQVSFQDPQGESTCDARTKLKMFETGIQTKKSSKKKMSETIFCLVSIPVKSESHLPDIDTNNNDLKQSADKKNGLDKSAALQEQSPLSTSSTDLELQALTGSVPGRTELRKQGLGGPEDDKQTNDLRFIHPTKHRELKDSGLWPGHQYRDQQTQTSFAEESRSLQPLPAEKLGGPPDAVLTPKCVDPAVLSKPQGHLALAPSDQNQRPNARPPKAQVSLSPSSNSAFSRTSSSLNQAPLPRAGPSQPCGDQPRGEVVKGETTGPCNSQQLFGQFLLKPVSRRPWDLISQLESFNKELQEEEEESGHSSSGSSSGSSSEHSDPEWLPAGPAGAAPGSSAFREDSWEMRVEEPPRRSSREDPVLRSGGVKSASERWSEEGKRGHLCARPPSLGPLQVGVSRGEALLSADGSLMTEKGNQELKNRIDELALSPGPAKRTSSRLSDTKPASPCDPAELREPQESQKLSSVLNPVGLSKAVPPEAESREERGAVVSLSLASKPRGLSAPDLRSVGLTLAQGQSADELEGALGEASAIEIPPNESLQARAARILGIEVAVESLLPSARGTGQSLPPKPDEGAHRPASPGEESVSSPARADGPTVSTDAFYGRRKCGWTKSPLFVGERDSARRASRAPEHSGVDGALPSNAPGPEPRPSPQEFTSFTHEDVATKPPFRSTLFHVIERTPSVAGSEKRLRSTSKVIESLQEKLASPPRRADTDRLMRMKEVSSVSRMRLLSSRSGDSVEDAEELKAERGLGAQPGGLVTLNAGDMARKAEPSLSVSKGVPSLEENGCPAAQREQDVDQDFWCPDSYDPSRVERV